MKKIMAIVCVFCMILMTACSGQSSVKETSQPSDTNEAGTESAVLSDSKAAAETETKAPTPAETDSIQTETQAPMVITDGVSVRVGSLKGPTSMGLVSLMNKNQIGESEQSYTFEMVTAADELVAKIVSKEVDIALVPANMASVLYNKTSGGVSVININTLGVLYVVESGDTLNSIADLAGKTIYMTGKGTTPDYVLSYLLKANQLSEEDVTIEYKSEATEVAAVLAQDSEAIGLLPQPFVTVACAQNENLHIALDLTEEWNKVQGENGSTLVTGVTIVRNEFLDAHPEAVAIFQEEASQSVSFTNEHTEEAAEMVADLEIVAKAAIAQKAIPLCNITFIDGEAMKTALEGYLQVLFEKDPTSVGGSLPEDGFYYIP